MKIIGIIAEYNPFHNGHIYHINKIKEMYPDSLIILVLNGYFLQRGELSILTKEDKTKIALDHQVDIVVELPFIYGTQAADIFANYAINILEKLKCDYIICGSESNDIETIKKIANKQLNNPNYDNLVKEHLKKGLNYPTALAKSLNTVNFQYLPNDLLAISYQKAIIKNNFNIELKTIKRTNSFKDTTSHDEIISATNIRNKLKEKENITKYIPYDLPIININYEKLFTILKYKLNTDQYLVNYVDIDEGLEYRFLKNINLAQNIEEFIKLTKTKRYTYNKLNRSLIHILNNFKKEDNFFTLEYIRLLGFNKNGQKYLQTLKHNISFKINKDSILYQYELKASLIYDLINNTDTYKYELKNKPIIFK